MTATNRTRSRRTATPKVEDVETPQVEAQADTPQGETPETPKDEAKKPLAGGKLRWVFPNGKDQYPDGKTQFAQLGPNSYAITGEAGAWMATHTKDGVETPLVPEPGSFGRAYNACVTHHRKNRVVAVAPDTQTG